MKTIRLKVLIPILALAFICIAYSGWNIASMKSLKKSSIQNSESNSEAIYKLDSLSIGFHKMHKLLFVYFVTGNETAKTEVAHDDRQYGTYAEYCRPGDGAGWTIHDGG